MLEYTLKDDLKKAQLEKDEVKTETLRLLLSEIHNSEILLRQSSGQEKGPPAGGLSDEDVISVIQREVKKRKEAIVGFRSGGREDQAQKEEAELKVLESYLPAQLEEWELTEIIQGVINELGAASLQDMGKVIGVVMGRVGGKADGGRVSGIVKQRLSS